MTSKTIDRKLDKDNDLIQDTLEDECGCQTTRIFKPSYSYSTKLCKQHEDFRKNRKPYSKYVHHRGSCPYCHGYDEGAKQGACICGTYDRLGELDTIIKALKSGKSIEDFEKEDAELTEEVARVRNRRGREK